MNWIALGVGFAVGATLAFIGMKLGKWRERRRLRRVKICLHGIINRDVQ